LLIFILGWYWSQGYSFKKNEVTGETVEEAIVQNLIRNEPNFNNVIEEINLDRNTKLVFYSHREQNLVFANLVKKKWNGKWKVISSNSTRMGLHKGEYAPYLWKGLKTDKYMGMWGIILDPNVETIMLKYEQEVEAKVINRPGYPRIWYKLFQTEDDLSRIEKEWAIESNGEKVPWNKE